MIDDSKVMLFSNYNSYNCNQVKQIFAKYGIDYSMIELDKVANGTKLTDETPKPQNPIPLKIFNKSKT